MTSAPIVSQFGPRASAFRPTLSREALSDLQIFAESPARFLGQASKMCGRNEKVFDNAVLPW